MSKTEEFHIGSTPALIFGEKSEKVFLFVHGLHGRKEEALAFAEVVMPKGYQVLGIDLPLERKPWEVVPLLNEVCDYLYGNWKSVSIRANSIGSWFSLLAFQGRKVDRALFVSPILDMKKFIEGQPTREDDYYGWVCDNPITCWDTLTYILRPEIDLLVSEDDWKKQLIVRQGITQLALSVFYQRQLHNQLVINNIHPRFFGADGVPSPARDARA